MTPFGVAFVSVLFMMGLVSLNTEVMLVSVFLIYFLLLIYAIKKREYLMVYAGFLATFFVFLLGGLFCDRGYLAGMITQFGEDATRVTVCCLYLSLLATYLGTLVVRNKTKTADRLIDYSYENRYICFVSQVAYYCTICLSIAEKLEKAIYVQQNSYVALYSSFVSGLPSIVHRLAECNGVFFCVFLASMPTRKQTIPPVCLYLMTSIIGLFSGSRGEIAYPIVFVVLYFCYRQKIADRYQLDEVWVTKWMKRICLISAPFGLIFLSVYASIRSGIAVSLSDFWSEFTGFFVQQGGSVTVIARSELNRYEMFSQTENVSYLFGPVINYFKYGFFGSLISGAKMFGMNTVEAATIGNNLGATISYLEMPANYLNGAGLGTQYIAEAFVDFGYWGVFLFNFFLGMFVKSVNYFSSRRWYFNALFLIIITSILMMPRNFALNFVPNLLSVKNILLFITIGVCAGIMKRKREKQ